MYYRRQSSGDGEEAAAQSPPGSVGTSRPAVSAAWGRLGCAWESGESEQDPTGERPHHSLPCSPAYWSSCPHHFIPLPPAPPSPLLLMSSFSFSPSSFSSSFFCPSTSLRCSWWLRCCFPASSSSLSFCSGTFFLLFLSDRRRHQLPIHVSLHLRELLLSRGAAHAETMGAQGGP